MSTKIKGCCCWWLIGKYDCGAVLANGFISCKICCFVRKNFGKRAFLFIESLCCVVVVVAVAVVVVYECVVWCVRAWLQMRVCVTNECLWRVCLRKVWIETKKKKKERRRESSERIVCRKLTKIYMRKRG